MARILSITFLAIALGVGTCRSQGRAANTNTWTDIGLEKCAQENPPPINPVHAGTWNCLGYDNVRVKLMEFDLRILVFVTFAKNSQVATRWVPSTWMAAKRRLRVGDYENRWLTEICRIGSVSAKDAVDANEGTRKVADDVTPKFRCDQDKAAIRSRL